MEFPDPKGSSKAIGTKLSVQYYQRVLSKGSGNAACSPLALHCGGKSYLGAKLDKEGGHLA